MHGLNPYEANARRKSTIYVFKKLSMWSISDLSILVCWELFCEQDHIF
jgi:hypothetical protein